MVRANGMKQESIEWGARKGGATSKAERLGKRGFNEWWEERGDEPVGGQWGKYDKEGFFLRPGREGLAGTHPGGGVAPGNNKLGAKKITQKRN